MTTSFWGNQLGDFTNGNTKYNTQINGQGGINATASAVDPVQAAGRTAYMNGTNGAGASYWDPMTQVNNAYMQYLGRTMDPSGRDHFGNLIEGGGAGAGGVESMISNIQNSDEARAYAASGVDNPFASLFNGTAGGGGATGGTTGGTTGGGGGFDDGVRGRDGGMGSLGTNPYLGAQTQAITQQSKDLFGQLNNQITSQSVGTGGLGGTRQGVAQGVAQGQAQNYLQSNLANLYGSAYNADQNRDLQRYGIDTNSAIQNKSLDNNFFLGNNAQRDAFYNANRGMDITQLGIGANLFSNTLGTVAGNSGSNNLSSGDTGFNWQGALGGLLGGLQLGNNWSR
jgi:hypothetical protein